MSKASEALAALAPFRAMNHGPMFTRQREVAAVQDDGGMPCLYLCGERWLDPADALRLAAWIALTFGDAAPPDVGRPQ